jgi:catechol 2,3-dioxygenase-like lactoylglutathione lyase family enzyme
MAKALINIDVDDLEKAVAFYTAAFGLQVGRRLGSGAVELLGAEAPLYLLLKTEDTPAFASGDANGSRRSYARHWTPVHLDFLVDDLEAAIARAEAAGATTEGPVQAHAWGRIAFLADPFGHGFCLIELSERGYDAIAR